MLKQLRLLALAGLIATPVMADETGTSHVIGAGPRCFKIKMLESGTLYAVDYQTTSTIAAMGYQDILVDFSDWTSNLTIRSDGTKAQGCPTYYRINKIDFN